MIVVLLAALCVGAGPASQDPADVPFVLTRLGLDLNVDYERGTVGGTASLALRNVSDHAAAAVPLLVNRLMTVSRIEDAAGADVPFVQRVALFRDDSARQVDAIVVTPSRPVAPGDSLTLVVHYGGVLVGYTETGSLYIQDHVSREFTIIREDAYAFPVLGALSRTANRAARREPFTFDARVAVPADLVVAMGGERGGRVARDSMAAWSYHSHDPVPFLNITIAPYQVLESPSARIFYFPEDSSGARMVQQAIAGAVERYTRWFGPLGRAPQIAVMEIPDGFGSQASLVAGIIQTAAAFRDRAQLGQLYHELSHVWNVADRDRPSPRWNEGLAMYLQWRMAGELDGWSGWDAQLDRTTQSLLRRCGQGVRCDSLPLAGYGAAGLTDRSYGVGMLMFYALAQTLGAETFDRTYRGFFQRYRDTGATTADLVAAFRKASPRSGPVLDDWLLTTRWYTRLASGETVRHIIAGYAAR
ncbi:MAG TPA: hypothetical protein VNH63_02600 [Gemmatimonadales bacterium]|nr:hypothetical protein [Gemmatimonadales bacterium]